MCAPRREFFFGYLSMFWWDSVVAAQYKSSCIAMVETHTYCDAEMDFSPSWEVICGQRKFRYRQTNTSWTHNSVTCHKPAQGICSIRFCHIMKCRLSQWKCSFFNCFPGAHIIQTPNFRTIVWIIQFLILLQYNICTGWSLTTFKLSTWAMENFFGNSVLPIWMSCSYPWSNKDFYNVLQNSNFRPCAGWSLLTSPLSMHGSFLM